MPGYNTRALFVWFISRTFLANERYFSLTTNQPTVLSAMAYQPSEQGNTTYFFLKIIVVVFADLFYEKNP